MRVRDEVKWHEFLANVAQDKDPKAAAFRQFLITWAEAAEMMLRQEYNAAQGAWGDFDSDPLEDIMLTGMPPVGALRETLYSVEKQLGAISVGFLGGVLVALNDHWYFGENLESTLTPIEACATRSVRTITELGLMAQQAVDESDGH